MPRLPLAGLLALTLLASSTAFALPPAPLWSPDHPRCRLLGDEPLRDPRSPVSNVRARTDRPAARSGGFDGCPHSFDALHYEVNLDSLDVATQWLEGHVVLKLESQQNALASIDLDLAAPLAATSVTLLPSTPLTFSQLGDVLTIDFGVSAPDLGDTVSVDVAYEGTPWNEGTGGFGGFWMYGFPRTMFSMGVGLNADPPSMGRTWFPCYDKPCDKATVDVNVTVPLNHRAMANGLLVSVDSTATNHTWRWSHDFPTSTYLTAVSAARYRVVSDTVVTDPRIDVWVHPQVEDEAVVSFQNVDAMMATYESLFGPYPFDKFAYMTTPIGDMEHQTCVSHALSLVNGANTFDDILAHEMTHQWFGDCVTYGSWDDVWLSEGFATYGEALFREAQGGSAAYHSYVTAAIQGAVLNSGTIEGVWNADDKWGTATYEKGGALLHMLRGVLDDDPLFFQVLNDYHANHAYGNAVTTDFVAGAAVTTGQDLTWFFDPWLYGEGHPIYEYGWSYDDLGGGQFQVDVLIRQIQTTANLFDMPVDFRVQTAGGDFEFSERIDLAEETVSFVVGAEPTGLLVDPDDWILDEQQLAPTSVDFGPDVAAAQSLRLLPPRPNPASLRARIDYYVPRAGRVAVTLHDVQGRRLRTLSDEVEQPGARSITWDRRTDSGRRVASGVYWVRVATDREHRTAKVILVD